MSIVELSNEIGKLAQIINEKNQELDELRKNYDAKLQIINKYISSLPTSSSSSSAITDDQFIKQVSTPISCPQCQHTIWDIQKPHDSEFLLIPKQCIQTQSKVESSRVVENLPPQTKTIHESKNKNKSKVICSYCKKTGHTRAKCRTRLNTPVSTSETS
ncbi:hypothetical protein SBY92_004049 [Candida maltosa Xu316]|uniref:CCHC-type domain-containing protein n=1 Tax=Candida maltosa (strain Xu316) TaxID=1245528 RepID=M3IQH5_CANMX|nr:hypothetical protein G210_0657 [Candida maltosa Xu316]